MEEDCPENAVFYDSDIVDSDIEISLYSQIHFEENSHDDTHSKNPEFEFHVDGNDNSGFLAPTDTRGILLNRSIGYEVQSDEDEDENHEINSGTLLDSRSDPKIDSVKDQTCVKADWNVNREDRPYVKPKPHARRYYKPFRCLNCNEVGHMSKTCPLPKKHKVCGFCSENGHTMRDCPESVCFNCLGSGHVSRECPVYRRVDQPCFKCHRSGHQKLTCPDHWRQYHNTVVSGKLVQGKNSKRKRVTYCFNCAGDDHLGHECHEERMHWRVSINSPFIKRYQENSNNYDDDGERHWKRPRWENSNDSKPVKKVSTYVPVNKKDNSYTGRNNFDNMQTLKQTDIKESKKKKKIKKKNQKKEKKKVENAQALTQFDGPQPQKKNKIKEKNMRKKKKKKLSSDI